MKLLFFAFLITFLCADIGYAQNADTTTRKFNLAPGITSKDYIAGTVIVKFKPESSAAIVKPPAGNTANGPQIALKSAKIVSVSLKFSKPVNTNNNIIPLKQDDPVGLDRIYEIRFSGDTSIVEVINELLKNPQIEYAEPAYIYHTNYIPNDPFYTNQNYLNQVKAPLAWDLIHSSSGIIIAIVDTGSDLDHPDLAANIHINTTDPIDGIDNDSDGYIDNNKGWDLVGLSGTNRVQDNDPSVTSDSTRHGVHVSGIASAVSNNGIGVASIASDAKLMIIKVSADNDASSIYAGYEGIKYAADHGAKIINCSWGGYSASSFGLDIINYALSKDCLIIAAAGNDNTSTSHYPSAYPGVISVASVDNNDIKSGFSNYGSKVSITAPGSNIYNILYNNIYGTQSGTSMAAPLVSSAAALIKAYFPAFTMQQVGQLLISSAESIDSKNPSFAGQLGFGRLNVYTALTQNYLQAITFPAIPSKTYGDPDFDPGAKASSGLPVSYTSSNLSVATIVNGKVHIAGAGTTTITASQSGNSTYNAAVPVSQTLTVNKASQVITFAEIPVLIRGGAPYTLPATSSSGLPINFSSSDPLVALIVNNTLKPLKVGKAIITAVQEGNANYLPATATQNVQITDTDGSVVKILAAVSPNGDGINDFLTIEGIRDYENNNVSIFTGNGAQVLQINNYNNADHVFNGEGKNGQTLPQGTYFYLVQFILDGQQQRETGYFVLKY